MVIPTAHPSSTFENHHQTWVANGVDELAEKMRAYRRRHDKRLLSQDEIMQVVERLRLSPVGLAFLEGRALDRATGKGIAGVEVRLVGEQLAEDLVETTDDQGRFRATVPVGTLTLDFRPPSPYEGRRFTYEARQGQNRVQDQEFGSVAPATPAAPDPREELGKLLEQVQQLLARSSVKAEVEASKTILEVLERERREREALYELILEQASRPQQSLPGDPHPPSQELLNELQEIRRLLGQITEARTPQERSQAVHQVQTLLPQLFDRPLPAAAPSTAARAVPVEVIEARPAAPPRPAETVRRRTTRWPLALALLPLVILGGWLAWPRPSGDTPAPLPAPSAAAYEAEEPTATGLEDARTTVSSPSSRTALAPAPDVREPPAANPSPAPASEPRAAPRATPQPLSAPTPEPDVKAPAKASEGRLQPKTPTPPAPTARSVPQATPEPAVRVTPPRGEPKPSTSTAGPLPGEPLPGAPLEPEPSAAPVAEPLPGEALPGQPLAASQGVAPMGAYCPATHPVKGNLSYSGERIYHLPNQEYYDKTKPEVCFATAGEAEQAGFRPSSR
ncbi:hypothetical protein Mrose_03349 [Calidithermus roseus]|uniref:Uncharacterized protein n=2 Tax=Calidithermus roseus TaxID=1644118 RepID=A0A399EH92_9DEIN|nr:hypothetical protein Mrose_03349 [Calidithermus roseus]